MYFNLTKLTSKKENIKIFLGMVIIIYILIDSSGNGNFKIRDLKNINNTYYSV